MTTLYRSCTVSKLCLCMSVSLCYTHPHTIMYLCFCASCLAHMPWDMDRQHANRLYVADSMAMLCGLLYEELWFYTTTVHALRRKTFDFWHSFHCCNSQFWIAHGLAREWYVDFLVSLPFFYSLVYGWAAWKEEWKNEGTNWSWKCRKKVKRQPENAEIDKETKPKRPK